MGLKCRPAKEPWAMLVVVVVVEADLWLWWPIEDLGDAKKSAPSNLPPYIQKKSFLGWFNK